MNEKKKKGQQTTAQRQTTKQIIIWLKFYNLDCSERTDERMTMKTRRGGGWRGGGYGKSEAHMRFKCLQIQRRLDLREDIQVGVVAIQSAWLKCSDSFLGIIISPDGFPHNIHALYRWPINKPDFKNQAPKDKNSNGAPNDALGWFSGHFGMPAAGRCESCDRLNVRLTARTALEM